MAGVVISVGKMWDKRDSQRADAVTNTHGYFSLQAGPEKEALLFAAAEDRPVVSVPAPIAVDVQTSISITVYPPASISGMVLAPDGQPAGNTHIQVDRSDSAHKTGMPGNLPPARSRSDGSFNIENLPGGKISLHANREGDVPSDFVRLDIEPGEKRSGITLRLGKGFTIEGRITDEQGKPVPDARITVDGVNQEKPIFANTQSDLDGRYKLMGVPDVPLDIKFWAPRAGLNGKLPNVRPGAGRSQDIVLRRNLQP